MIGVFQGRANRQRFIIIYIRICFSGTCEQTAVYYYIYYDLFFRDVRTDSDALFHEYSAAYITWSV